MEPVDDTFWMRLEKVSGQADGIFVRGLTESQLLVQSHLSG